MKTEAITILAGAILFIISAFLPYTRMFIEPDADKKLEIIKSSLIQWNLGTVTFAISSLLCALGVAMVALKIQNRLPANLAWVAVVLLVIGALLWSWHCVERLRSPEGFVYGNNTPHLFTVYSILTTAGMFLLGLSLLWTLIPAWVSWTLMIGMVLVAIAWLVFKDVPPFVYYLFFLVLGIKLLGITRAGIESL